MRQESMYCLPSAHTLRLLDDFLYTRGSIHALSSAAHAMGQALAAAVPLIEHVDHQSVTVLERRQPKNRR